MSDKIKNPTILITGSESNVGMIITKQVCSYKGIGQLYVGSVEPVFPANQWVEKLDCVTVLPDFYKKQTTTEKIFIDFLLDFVKEKKIDILMSGSNFELEVLAKHRQDFQELGCKIIIESLFTFKPFTISLKQSFFLKVLVFLLSIHRK